MDERLKNIMDNFEALQIGLDDRFEFRCLRCRKCCTRTDILLNPIDFYNLRKKLGITSEDLIKQYGEIYVGMDSRIPIVRLRPRGPGKRCPFLKNRKCQVHDQAKPTVCAMFPLGRYLVAEDTGKAAGETVSREIRYIFNHPGCGDRSETHTVREWLERFGIPVADEFFFMWQEIVLKMSMFFRKVEDRMSGKTMQLLWSVTLSALYLNYDMDREFMPQFEENVRGLGKLLNTVFPDGK